MIESIMLGDVNKIRWMQHQIACFDLLILSTSIGENLECYYRVSEKKNLECYYRILQQVSHSLGGFKKINRGNRVEFIDFTTLRSFAKPLRSQAPCHLRGSPCAFWSFVVDLWKISNRLKASKPKK